MKCNSETPPDFRVVFFLFQQLKIGCHKIPMFNPTLHAGAADSHAKSIGGMRIPMII
jgi:hypothetical protein